MKTFELNNIKVSQENNGVVSIQFYNVAGFEQAIKVIAGYDYNGDDADDRVFYAFEKENPVRSNNVDCGYDIFCIHSIENEDGELLYYDNLFDFVVDSVGQYFKKGNKFITALINRRIYSQLV